jgi:hypothetical protein
MQMFLWTRACLLLKGSVTSLCSVSFHHDHTPLMHNLHNSNTTSNTTSLHTTQARSTWIMLVPRSTQSRKSTATQQRCKAKYTATLTLGIRAAQQALTQWLQRVSRFCVIFRPHRSIIRSSLPKVPLHRSSWLPNPSVSTEGQQAAVLTLQQAAVLTRQRLCFATWTRHTLQWSACVK